VFRFFGVVGNAIDHTPHIQIPFWDWNLISPSAGSDNVDNQKQGVATKNKGER